MRADAHGRKLTSTYVAGLDAKQRQLILMGDDAFDMYCYLLEHVGRESRDLIN